MTEFSFRALFTFCSCSITCFNVRFSKHFESRNARASCVTVRRRGYVASSLTTKMASMASQLQALNELLKPKENDADSSSDDEVDTKNRPKFNPGNIGPAKKIDLNSKKELLKDIWASEEVPVSAHTEDEYDPRPAPEYEMIFKQAVTSEDMFLQMGNKNPSTASCEDLVIKIKLPGTEFKDIELDVTDKFLDCRTPKYKLALHLPHKVDSANGKAQMDTGKELLTVTLRMIRDFDFLNS